MDRKKQIFHNNTITTSKMSIARTEYSNVHCRFKNLDVCSFEKKALWRLVEKSAILKNRPSLFLIFLV